MYAGCIRTSHFDDPYTGLILQVSFRDFDSFWKGRGSERIGKKGAEDFPGLDENCQLSYLNLG